MKTVKLSHSIKDGVVVFSVSEPTELPPKYFSQPHVKEELKKLYRERHELDRWRTIDKSMMEKTWKMNVYGRVT